MSVFSSRSSGYKGGVVLLFFATVVFIVGFVVPFWTFVNVNYAQGSYSVHQGVWMRCAAVSSAGYSESECASYQMKDVEGAFHAVRALESLCLIGLVASCIYALVTNCCRSVPGPHLRVLEILAGLSGLLGFIGCMVFVGKIKEGTDTLFKDVHFEVLAFLGETVDNPHFGFYLATIGSGLCVVAAIIIAVSNKPLEVVTQGVVNTVPMTTYPQGQVQGQGQPAAGGDFYGQAQAQPYGYHPQFYGNHPQSYGYLQPQGYTQVSYGYPAAI